MKKNINLATFKWIVIGAVAIMSIIGFLWYVSFSNPQTQAIQPKVLLSLSPPKGDFSFNGEQVVTAILQTEDPTKKISAFDMIVRSNSNLNLVSIGLPASYPDGNTTIFTPIIQKRNEISYVVNLPSSQLPSKIIIPITIKGVKDGARGILTVKIKQATGNIVVNNYNTGQAQQKGQYTFSTKTPGPPP